MPEPEILAAVTIVQPQPRPYVMVMEALTPDGRRFYMGKGIGHVVDEQTSDIRGTLICQEVLKRLTALRRAPGTKLWVLELTSPALIDRRLPKMIANVGAGDLLLLLCADSATIDACVPWFEIREKLDTVH
jgi:hypothetical protein